MTTRKATRRAVAKRAGTKVAKRAGTKVAKTKSRAAVKIAMSKVYASPSMMLSATDVKQPAITRGETGKEKHYFVNRDGSIDVPTNEVEDFIAMGCAHDPQEPVEVSNVAPQQT